MMDVIFPVIASKELGFNCFYLRFNFLEMNITQEEYSLQQQLEEEKAARRTAEERLDTLTKALQESRKFAKSLTNTIPNIVYILDLEKDRCTYINQFIQTDLGYTVEDIAQMKGHVFRSIIIREDQPRLLNNVAFLEQAGDDHVLKAEYRVRDKADHLKYLYCRERVFKRNERGQVRQIIGIAEDITSLREKTFELRQQKDFYETILSSIPSDITVYDPELRYQFANPAAIAEKEMREWIIGKTDEEYFALKKTPSPQPETRSWYLSSIIKEKEALEFEEKVTDEQGKPTYKLRSLSPVLDEQDVVKLIIGYSFDVTERKRHQDEIKEKNELIGLILNTSPNYVYIRDSDGRMLLVNQAYARLFGKKEEEIIGLELSDFYPSKEDYAFLDASDRRAMEERREVSTKDHFTKAGGEEVWVQTVRRPLITPGGEVHVLGIATDITEQVLVERALKKSKELAEDSVRLKENFLANMSHEIRTPMNGILGIGKLLAKTSLNETQENYVKIIRQSAENLLVVINDILDLGKMDADKLELEKIPFDLREVLKVARQTLFYKAEEKDIAFDVMLPVQLENQLLEGDPYRLNQVLLNLMSNAIKFTQEGGVTLSCRVLEESPAAVQLEFAVADTGIGIPEDKKQEIFEEFTQAYTSTTRKYGGTGLGLNICKKLVKLQGGRIWVESEVGKGSVFKFTLTYSKCAEALSQISDEDVAYNSLGNIRVLLAEDNEVNVLLAQTILENWGAQVDVARNGKEALEQFENQEYAVILMDIQMPEMNGMEVTKLIRAHPDPEKAETPVIALTANALKQDAEKYLKAGMDDYIPKPFQEKELYLKISNLLLVKARKGNAPALHKIAQMPISTQVETAGEKTQAPLSMQNLTVCNLTYLEELTDNDKAFMDRIVGMFLEQVPSELDRLQAGVDSQNMAEVQKIAHKIKSTVSLLGAKSMGLRLKEIEELASSSTETAKVEQLCRELVAKGQTAIKELRALFPDVNV